MLHKRLPINLELAVTGRLSGLEVYLFPTPTGANVVANHYSHDPTDPLPNRGRPFTLVTQVQ
jgi:hypothetical protein